MVDLNNTSTDELHAEIERRNVKPLVDFAKAIRYSSKLQEAIHQDKFWTDNEGRVWSLEKNEMDYVHMINLLDWLEDRMQSLHVGAEFRLVLEAVRPWPLSDAVADAIEAEQDKLGEMTDYEFFCSLPLVRRLRELTGEPA